MASESLEIAKKFWEEYSPLHSTDPYTRHRLAQELSNRLVHIFHPGDFYYFVFNISMASFDYLSPSVEQVLGYKREEMTTDAFFDLFHPDDLKTYVNSEYESGKFLRSLSKDRLFKYKLRTDFRMRKKDGQYTRILHQTMVFDTNEEGAVLRSFGVHTDIGYLKMDGKSILSFIGFDGEPSYFDVKVGEHLIPMKEMLSTREKEILLLIMDGLHNKGIAAKLHISKETVDKHRKNMLAKTGCKNSGELITRAIKNGWI
ncbi:MAG: LuxR C-terminal-related transcriptional regulator [Puia sp.]|nr:LuxR C-terminal-related transcriptional regulator [Puia sp.]